MDDKFQINFVIKECITDIDIKQEQPNTYVCSKDNKTSVQLNETLDKKDLLIARLQEQIAKQKECISYYESIVQLMNYKLMKFKKVWKTH